MRRKILKHAPIVEAILQINLASNSIWDKGKANAFATECLEGFSLEGELVQEKVDLMRKNNNDAQSDQIAHTRLWGANRYIKNGSSVVVIFPSAIAFSKLPPYPDIQNMFYGEAYGIIDKYLQKIATKPAIARIGLRYINRLSLADTQSPSDLIRFLPKPLSRSEIDKRKGFLYQESYQRTVCGYVANAMITKVFPVVNPAKPSESSIVLDIDSSVCPQIELDVPTIKNIVNGLRSMKNDLFFKALTQNAIKGYK